MKLSIPQLLAIVSASIAAPAMGCDLCGCYLPPAEVTHRASYDLYGGVSEQFTYFGSLRFDGHEVNDPVGQYLNSSTTQLFFGASLLENRLALQVNVPLIYRSYKRPEGFDIEHGDESGLGDISLLANYTVFSTKGLNRQTDSALSKDGKKAVVPTIEEPAFAASLNLIAGIKLPTGDSGRLKEEFNEVEVEGAPESGIHGHDLALGTGSYDAILGAQLYLRYKSLFFQADTQFTIRGDGRHSYHFANDLSWSGGPGVYVIRRDDASLGLQCVISGEYKDTDRFQGRTAEDTAITSLYVGPRVTAHFGRVTGEVGIDLPVVLDNSSLQAVPDYRIRGGFTVHF